MEIDLFTIANKRNDDYVGASYIHNNVNRSR